LLRGRGRCRGGEANWLMAVRFTAPSAEGYAKKIKMAELDLEMTDADEERRALESKKGSYVWRGLRAASRKQMSSFDRMEHGRGLEALQAARTSAEIAGDDTASSVPGDQGGAPQTEESSVEEQRAGQAGGGGQVTGEVEMK
jgi:THO complex subunit 1